MKSKKFLSLLLAVLLLCGSVSASFEAIAANSVSVDAFIDSVEVLNTEETEKEKSFEESVGSRVIVKAMHKPDIFGNAQYMKGTHGKHIFQYTTEAEATEALEHYRSLSEVVYAVIDGVVKTQGIPYAEAMLGTQRAKEYIEEQKIPQESVNVGILDTGIEFTHELYKDNPRVINSGINMTDTGYKDSAWDDEGHGSIVAEIVMDNTPESVNVVGYKVLNTNGAGTYLWIATAIEKAVEDGIDVINLSLGGEAEPLGYESGAVVLEDSINYAIEKGVLVVVASGNDGHDASYFSPANVKDAITVGAIDKAGNPAYFSNFGECVDFVAPGVEIEHDYVKITYEYDDDGYVTQTKYAYKEPVDGTSFSSPYVAAVAATTLCVYPDLSSAALNKKLTHTALTYEDLYYHDNLHPITEDQGMPIWGNFFHRYEDTSHKQIYYGSGMPQADMAIVFQNEAPRTQTPCFSQEGGHYVDEEFDLILSSEAGAEIYYTQDESYPTKENGIKYNGSVHIDELQSVRAVAFCEGKAPSTFSAQVYRMEYHVPESEFTLTETKVIDGTTYNNVITSYTGTKASVICPDTIDGKPVGRFEIKTPNTFLRTLRLPETCTTLKFSSRYWSTNPEKNAQRDLKIIHGPGLVSLSALGKYYPSLVELNAPKLKSVTADNSNIRRLYVPEAQSVGAKDAHCLKEVYAPRLKYINCVHIDPDTNKFVSGGSFRNCYSLETIYIPEIVGIGELGLGGCRKLKDFETNHLKHIHNQAFSDTNNLRRLICPELVKIYDGGSFSHSGIEYLYAPKLETISYHIGTRNYEYDDGLIEDYSFFTSKLIVSSTWTDCKEEAEGYRNDPYRNNMRFFYHLNLEIYGTPNTYAQEYANQFHLKFVPLPLLESEPEDMGYSSDGVITADVLGFNKEYQWYGTNIKDNRLGTVLQGETEETIDTSKYDYNYYYCVVKTHDGEYKKDIVTGTQKTLDMNGDSVIDIADLSILLCYYGTAPEKDIYDVNEDGIIDIQDIQYLLFSTVYGTKE